MGLLSFMYLLDGEEEEDDDDDDAENSKSEELLHGAVVRFACCSCGSSSSMRNFESIELNVTFESAKNKLFTKFVTFAFSTGFCSDS